MTFKYLSLITVTLTLVCTPHWSLAIESSQKDFLKIGDAQVNAVQVELQSSEQTISEMQTCFAEVDAILDEEEQAITYEARCKSIPPQSIVISPKPQAKAPLNY